MDDKKQKYNLQSRLGYEMLPADYAEELGGANEE